MLAQLLALRCQISQEWILQRHNMMLCTYIFMCVCVCFRQIVRSKSVISVFCNEMLDRVLLQIASELSGLSMGNVNSSSASSSSANCEKNASKETHFDKLRNK